MSLPSRCVSADWPRLLTPAPGCLLPVAPLAARERVLHVAPVGWRAQQPWLVAALQRAATAYSAVDIDPGAPVATADALLSSAAQLAPTLVWMQVQLDLGDALPPALIARLRAACAPNVVIVNWDGDQHWEPDDAGRRWFVALGRVLDASLVKNTAHPARYAALGVRHPGYLDQGTDWPATAASVPGWPPVVFVANDWSAVPGHGRRTATIQRLCAWLGPRFGLYGHGWGEIGQRPITAAEATAAYRVARAALSMSVRCDLPRYTSNRLLNILAAGGVALVERFPDMAGLGLVDNVNCLTWSTDAELDVAIDRALTVDTAALRVAARDLAAEYTWEQHVAKLLFMVDAIRSVR